MLILYSSFNDVNPNKDQILQNAIFKGQLPNQKTTLQIINNLLKRKQPAHKGTLDRADTLLYKTLIQGHSNEQDKHVEIAH